VTLWRQPPGTQTPKRAEKRFDCSNKVVRTWGAANDDVGHALAEGGLRAGVVLRRARRHARCRRRIDVRPQSHLHIEARRSGL